MRKMGTELELKYIIEEFGEGPVLEQVVDLFIANGFKKISTEVKQNNDEYYDTPDLTLYQNGGSLRIRQTTKDEKTVYKCAYKIPRCEKEAYHSRTEIEKQLLDSKFESLRLMMESLDVPVDFNKICNFPILNSTTVRVDTILEKAGFRFCLSFDIVLYTNHSLYETMATDKMMEIEAVGEPINRSILNEIHGFISREVKNITLSHQSKYERGINSTKKEYEKQLINNPDEPTPQPQSTFQKQENN